MENDKKTTLTLTTAHETKTVDLYSNEGLELVSLLWVKLYAQYKLTHDVPWTGIPIIQFPEDILMMQELIWKVRPDVIVECGIAHGGSLVFYSSLFELIDRGRVIGIDVDIRKHNRIAIEKHPMSHRIEMIEGSSTSEEVIHALKKMIKKEDKVIVILDSNHSKDHVAKELQLYKDLVTPGSYLVVMDGAQAFAWDIPNGKEEWKEDNPLIAIEEFVDKTPQFTIDPHYNRLRVTSNPKGFLRKLTEEECKKGV
jgi:cephalosporin hydroxylase